MTRKSTWLTVALASVVLATGAGAQILGTTLERHGIGALQGPDAKHLRETRGRLVLFEFFAYW